MIKYVTLPILKKFIIDEDVDLKVGCRMFMSKQYQNLISVSVSFIHKSILNTILQI